jgi:hypothetical protein
MDEQTRTRIEAAVFRRLVAHLQERTDVRNRDLTQAAGFCRDELAAWYSRAALEHGEQTGADAARQRIYGMSYAQWQESFEK